MDPNTQELVMGAAGASGGPKVYVEDVFSTYLYTGNGTTQTITNGIDLSGKGGLVWMKSRTVAQNNWLFDTARSTQFGLVSNLTNAEINQGTGFSSFNSNGFSLSGQTGFNGSSENIVSWTFRKAAKFFDVVTYTGNGSNRTIAHSLGSVPGCIIVKRTDTQTSGSNWIVYHRSLQSPVYAILLNSTSQEQVEPGAWNSTAPTSSVFSIGTGNAFLDVNVSGGTYVAYLFAHDAGGFGDSGNDNVISCGSYTGNGSNNGPEINLGWEPQWVLTKGSGNNGSSWQIIDMLRGFTTGNDAALRPNTSGTEVTADYLSPTASGFKVSTGSNTVNFSGETFIYIAIRRGPMKTPTDATKVFTSVANTASSSGQTNTSGFPVDLSIDEGRSTNYGAAWFDRLRGRGPYLLSSSTNAEANQDPTYYVGFDSNTGVFNKNYGGLGGGTYVNWLFRRAPGFFDVVAYAGNGTSNRNVPHNLGIVPELVIIKNRSGASYDWVVTTNFGVTTASELYLNTTQSQVGGVPQVYGNLTLANKPTSTNLVFGYPYGAINASGITYVSYLFATCPGVSKVGSYTGTGTTQQINCNFTNGSRFVLIKRTDSTGDWYVWDAARGIISGNDPFLLLNSSAAENTGTDYIDPLSTGFEISSTAPTAINASGGTYIFLAIA